MCPDHGIYPKSYQVFRRYGWLLQRLRTEQEVSAPALAEVFGLSVEQAARHIKDLIDFFNLPAEYDPQSKNYHLTREMREMLPAVWIREEDALLLAVVSGLVRDPETQQILLADLQKMLRVHGTKDLDKVVQLVTYKGSGYYQPLAQGILTRMLSLMVREQDLRVSYQALSGEQQEPATYVVTPLKLVFYNSNWYLLCQREGTWMTLALARMVAVEGAGTRLDLLPDVQEVEARIQEAFGIFLTTPGQAVEQVRLCFAKSLAKLVRTLVFHPKQTLLEKEDGRLEVSFPSTLNHELIAEVLRYTGSVEVVEPAALRDKVLERLKAGLELMQGS